nr:MAG TPA: Protein of unknown function (DUF1642) [Caudoviricetes sp.]
MNKQELIGKYEYLNHNFFRRVDTSEVLRDLKQLDEPEKVKVPQFVADWYEEHKDDFEFNVWDWIAFRDELEKLENKEFTSWINDCEGNPIQILVNMHQFGYEVEKEPKYTVKIKATKHYFAKDGNGRIYFSLKYESAFTKIELEKVNLGWVFDCEGIEVKEVE